jgi:hypothetical protein
MSRLHILILTATVAPKPGSPSIARIDAKTRLCDYMHALENYLPLLHGLIDHIIFAENSNSDITTLRNMVVAKGLAGRVEFLSFNGLDYPVDYDRAYGEFKLIDYVMSHSEVVRERHESDSDLIFWKVTGRYLIRNLGHIIAKAPRNFDLYCNFRNWTIGNVKLLRWTLKCLERERQTDMFLFAWTRNGYQHYIHDVYQTLNVGPEERRAGRQPEERWRQILDSVPNHLRIVRRINSTPEIEGVRAYDNKTYHIDNRWKFQLRTALRVLIPWFWI